MPYQDLYVGSTPTIRSPTDFQYPTAAPKYPVYQPQDLSFGGVPEIGPLNSANLSYANTPAANASSYDTSPGLFSNLLSSFANVGASSPPAMRSPTDFQYPSSVAQTPTINTASVDGSTGFISNLRDQLGSVLSGIGSTGDNSGTVPLQAAWGREPEPEGMLTPTVILGVLAVGAVIYYATQS